jgi:hypothetical protein
MIRMFEVLPRSAPVNKSRRVAGARSSGFFSEKNGGRVAAQKTKRLAPLGET